MTAALALGVGLCTVWAQLGFADLPSRTPYRPPEREPYRPPRGTLYLQEGTPADGYLPINAAGRGPSGDPTTDSITNWTYRYGNCSWSGIYARRGWVKRDSAGDRLIDVEADIEIYCSMTNNSSYYFHIGNLYTASEEDLTAYPTGTLSSNAGMYVGLNLSAMSQIGGNSFEADGSGLTGRIFNAMVGTVDVLGRDISGESFDLKVLLSWDGGTTYNRPLYYGESPDGNTRETVWWLINGAAPGEYDLKWHMRLLPQLHQADGNYYFESEIVVAPFL